MHILISTFAGVLLAAVAACNPAPQQAGSDKDTGKPDTAKERPIGSEEQPPPAQEQTTQNPQQDSTLMLGKKVYESYCLACHQSDGSGVPGMYPPLTDTAWLANEEQLIQIILEGLSGKITVSGETYNQMMPTHNFLDDNEAAAVLNYIREQFGSLERTISAEQVKALRNK